MKDPYVIIERPLLTEKSMDLSAAGKYVFRVARTANKIEISKAVEAIFQVEVLKVNTMTVKGKPKKIGRFKPGHTPDWHKAIVTLRPGHTITLFEDL